MPTTDAVRRACAIPVLSFPGILSIALLVGTLSRADAALLVVPDEFPTVQAAVDAAESGDFIQIQPGVYLGEGNVNIDLQGKTLTIIGAGTDPDLQMFFLPSGGSVFNARSGEPPETTIAGLSFVGKGDPFVRVAESGLTLLDCQFTAVEDEHRDNFGVTAWRSDVRMFDCTFDGFDSAIGGSDAVLDVNHCEIRSGHRAINMYESISLLTDCTIEWNTGEVIYALGGLIALQECVVSNNSSEGADYRAIIHAEEGTSLVADGTRFENNVCAEGSLLQMGYQGGMASFDGCRFDGNMCIGPSGTIARIDPRTVFRGTEFSGNLYGDALLVSISDDYYPAGAFIECIVEGNVHTRPQYSTSLMIDLPLALIDGSRFDSNVAGGGVCGARRIQNSTFGRNSTGNPRVAIASADELRNCLFVGNRSEADSASTARAQSIINCTFAYNRASPGGAVFARDELFNTILWGNIPGQVYYDPADPPDIDGCIIEGGYPVGGWIDADPLLVDGTGPGPAIDYKLNPGSPAIDAGFDGLVPTDMLTDIDGNPRIVDAALYGGDPQYGAMYVDIGCFEMPWDIGIDPNPAPDPVLPCAGDLNNDGVIDLGDVNYALFRLGCTDCDEADNAGHTDGVIDVNDIAYVLFRLGEECP